MESLTDCGLTNHMERWLCIVMIYFTLVIIMGTLGARIFSRLICPTPQILLYSACFAALSRACFARKWPNGSYRLLDGSVNGLVSQLRVFCITLPPRFPLSISYALLSGASWKGFAEGGGFGMTGRTRVWVGF